MRKIQKKIYRTYADLVLKKYPIFFKYDWFTESHYLRLNKNKFLQYTQINDFVSRIMIFAKENSIKYKLVSNLDKLEKTNNNYLEFYTKLYSSPKTEDELRVFLHNEISKINDESSKLIPFFIDLSNNLIYPYKTLNEPESKKNQNTVNNYYSFNEEKNYNYSVKNDIVTNNHFEKTVNNNMNIQNDIVTNNHFEKTVNDNNLNIQNNYDNRTFKSKSKTVYSNNSKQQLTPIDNDYLFKYKEYKSHFIKVCNENNIIDNEGNIRCSKTDFIRVLCKAGVDNLFEKSLLRQYKNVADYIRAEYNWNADESIIRREIPTCIEYNEKNKLVMPSIMEINFKYSH